ncbi:Glutathione S-transferase [Amphibalanus amphitrite]|uniref:glutathione transferase n=1 Tax=Amphibalanus amphitrite TaxID=1232801 RepID=A0A6A4V6Q6_AMPAM|nr:Glutathione S-transferase [Amphibalanus amphitrite]
MGSVCSSRSSAPVEASPTTKMPSLKLVYFDGKGRGEPIRWILAAGGQAFEQEKFGFEEWPAKKPTTPYGSVPLLEVDGEPLCQTLAIARYAGTIGGLVSTDPFKNALGDEAADTMAELCSTFFSTMFEKDAEKKAADEKKLFEETMPKIFGLWESRMSTKFLTADKPIWQDVFLGHWLSRFAEINPQLIAKYPKLTALKDAVLQIDGVKKYLANPPTYSIPL